MQFSLKRIPFDGGGFGFEFDAETLQGLVKLSDGHVIDSLITLQALYSAAGSVSNCIGQLSLAAPSRAFQQDRFVKTGRQINRRGVDRIRNIPGGAKSSSEFLQ